MKKRPVKSTDRSPPLPDKRQVGLAEDAPEFVGEQRPYRLTDEQLAEVVLARKELDEGKVASQEEMDALWRRAGLIP